MYKYLNKFKGPKNIKKMSLEEINNLAGDIRRFLIDNVSKTGGHLAPNLGVVELTLSLFNTFNFPEDRIIWDVGHQSYVYKIITGRKDKFDKLRQYKGLSGFPKRSESNYDHFDTGHSSTSISAALGMARARDLKGENYNVIAVIGDGALTGGMAMEALNDAGDHKTKIIIILNDNEMSISRNVGGLSKYLYNLRVNKGYTKLRDEFNEVMDKSNVGKVIRSSVDKIKSSVKQFVVPSMFFEDMGLKYLGPINGHNVAEMTKIMKHAKDVEGPVIIHVITQKGKGYDYAENKPEKFHGVGPFDIGNGELNGKSSISYSAAFGNAICNIASEDKRVVAITAAMPDGTGLNKFAEKFKDRFFDVGIAEQHGVTLAAGLAKEEMRPVFAVYSTFLQRGFDQIVHDVCIQKLPVIFAVDRAGVVGDDGETHQGIFDISYLSIIPNMTILSPKCTDEMEPMLKWAVNENIPIAIRYPRGGDSDKIALKPLKNIEFGKWEVLREGGEINIIATGKMVTNAMLVSDEFKKEGIHIGVINAAFIKPIDSELIEKLCRENKTIVTIEDNVIHGGLGCKILEEINRLGYKNKIINLGYDDKFVEQGKVDLLYRDNGLDVEGIYTVIKEKLLLNSSNPLYLIR